MQNKAVHLNNDISSKSLLEFYWKLTFCRWVKLTTQFVGGWSDGRSRNRRIVWQFHDGVMYYYYTDTHSRGMSRTCGRVDGSRSSGFPTRANTWSLPFATRPRDALFFFFNFSLRYTARELIECPPHWDLKSFLDEKPCTDPNGILLSLAGSISAEAHILSCSALTS